jgi:hypothetical protein
VRTVDDDGVSTLSWQNVARVTAIGGSLSASLMQLGPASGFVSGSLYREVRDPGTDATGLSDAATRFSSSATMMVRPSPALSLQASVSYLPARSLPQGRISPMVFSTVGGRYRFLEGRGSINLAVVDPFQLQRFTFTTHDQSHVQTGDSLPASRRATLSIGYTFGRPPASNRRDLEEQDEREEAVPLIR